MGLFSSCRPLQEKYKTVAERRYVQEIEKCLYIPFIAHLFISKKTNVVNRKITKEEEMGAQRRKKV